MPSPRTRARKGAKPWSATRWSPRLRFASRCANAPSSSYDSYATPERPHGQPLVSVVLVFSYHHFSGEGAVNKGEVTAGQDDAEGPPYQSNLQPVGSSFGAGNGERINRVASRQHHGVNAEDHAGQHARQIRAGGEEPFALITPDQLEADAGDSRDREQRKHKAPGPSDEVFFHLRLNLEGHRRDQGGQRENAPPNSASQLAGALIHGAGRFRSEERRVGKECRSR